MPETTLLSASELEELLLAFRDVINYESGDPFHPIDPLTYRAPDGDTCLHIAARRDDLRSIALLLKAGANVNDLGDMNTTPLHCARNPSVISTLLAAGASTTIRDDFGRLPLDRS